MVFVEVLMTIGEFAKRTGLSVSAIRFYASHQLLQPAEVDRSTGYRHYAESQVADGVLIRNLRRLNMSLREIALALDLSEVERRNLVEQHLAQLEATVMRAHHLAQTMGTTRPKQETAMSTTDRSITVESLDLAQAFDQVLPAAGTDPELPHLMSVLIEGKAGSVRLVATDSYRLAIRDLVPTELDGDFKAIVPAASLAKWRAGLDEPATLSLRVSDGRFELGRTDHVHSTRLVPVVFPDYEKFLAPVDDLTRVTADKGQLLAALDDVGREEPLHLAVTKTALRLSCGDDNAEVAAAVAGPPVQVALNCGFVETAIRNSVGAEVAIEIEDSLKTVLFRSADDGTFTTRVMPIKL